MGAERMGDDVMLWLFIIMLNFVSCLCINFDSF